MSGGRRRALALGLALAAVAAGCSSGGNGDKTATAAARATPAAPSPTAIAPTPFDPTATPLKVDDFALDAYTIEIPDGWQAETFPSPGGFGRRYTAFESGARTAQVSVRCQRGATIESLSQQDQGLVDGIGGTYGIGGMTDVTAGGLSGKQTRYELALGGQTQQTRALYLQGATCAWQILLQAYGLGTQERYAAVFDAILATFKPTAPAG